MTVTDVSTREVGGAERVARDLRAQITDGVLMPGTRLVEDALSVELGVSRNTLREAFRLLVREHLLVSILNRGVFVREVSLAEAVDLYRARRAVELSAVRTAQVSDVAGIDEVVRWSRAGATAAARRDWTEVGTANMHFHEAIVALTGSERLAEFMRGVLAELRLVFAAAHDARAVHEPFVARNGEIADLIAAGRLEEAAAALAGYLDDAELQALAHLRTAR